MFNKVKLNKAVCRKCGFTGHAPEGRSPENFDRIEKQKKAPLGIRLQNAGAQMSVTMSGAKKGGYAMQELAARKTESHLVCPRCGSKKIAWSQIKVKTDESIRLLKQTRGE